jgi:CHAT domain-containing protein
LQKLRDRAGMSAPQPSKLAGELLAADLAGDEAKFHASLAENFTEVSTATWEYLLDDYLETLSSDNRAKADQLSHALIRLAQLIRETKADAYFLDQFNSVKALNAVRVGEIKEIRTLLAQGESAHKNGEYDKGVAFFSQALSAAERIGDVCHAEKAMLGLARTYTPQTETPRMSAIRQRLVGITSQRQHRQMQARALLALSNQYMAETKYSQLLEASNQAYEISRQIGDIDTSVNSLKFTGTAYDRLGKTNEVFKSFFTALRALPANSVNLLRDCQIYTNFSSALAGRKHYQEALEYQLEALPYCRQCNDLLFVSAQGRAWKYIVLTGQSEQAIRLFQNASFGAGRYNEATGMHSMLFDFYISLGDGCLRQKQSVEAAAAYQNALKLRGHNQPFHTQSRIYHGLALAYLQQSKNGEAETVLNKSIELAEQARENISEIDNRSAFTSSRNAIYQTMVEFQHSIKKSSARAFDYAEIYRARELFDVISQHKGVQWDATRKTIEVSGISTPKTLNQVQKSLPADVQIVEYAFTEQNLLIWVITASRLETVSVPLDRERFQMVVAGYLTALKQREAVNSLNASGQELYQLLIRPVESYFNKACVQVFVPDGVLKAIPFAALVSPVTNRYLIEDYALAVSPSASILAQLITQRETKRRAAESLLLVSNPRYSQKLFPGLKPLPGTDEEMANLRSFYPGLHQLAGEQATKKALIEMMGQYAIVHLATHSFLDEETPLSSAIVLATNAANPVGEVKESSILQAHEILRLKLPETRLVILSSCRSAASAPERSDGPATLAQAFFSAGVPAVIGSLWEVDDASTAKLMTAFHRAYRVSKLTPCQALRQSQLTLLSAGQGQWKHPYYWAAFLLSGDGFSS